MADLTTDTVHTDAEKEKRRIELIDHEIETRHQKIGKDLNDNIEEQYFEEIKNATTVLSTSDKQHCNNMQNIFERLCVRGKIDIGNYGCLKDIISRAEVIILMKFVESGEKDIARLNESKNIKSHPRNSHDSREGAALPTDGQLPDSSIETKVTDSHDGRVVAALPTDVQADAEPYEGGHFNQEDETLQGDFTNQLPDSSRHSTGQQSRTAKCHKNGSKEISGNHIEMENLHYDVLLLHTEKDYLLAKEIQEHLQTNENIVQGLKRKIDVVLYAEYLSSFNNHIECMGIGFKHCTYVLVLFTKNFSEDAKIKFLSNESLVQSLEDVTKRWCIVPVLANDSVELPFGYESLGKIRYDRKDECYFDKIAKMMNQRLHYRERREKKQKEEILESSLEDEPEEDELGSSFRRTDLNELRSGSLS